MKFVLEYKVRNELIIRFFRSKIERKELEEFSSFNEVDAEIFLLVLILRSLRRMSSHQKTKENYFDFLNFNPEVTLEEQNFWSFLFSSNQQSVNNQMTESKLCEDKNFLLILNQPPNPISSKDFHQYLSNLR